MATKRVLSVGQCSADHGGISRTILHHFDATVTPADSADEALAQLRQGGFDLVLVNRIFDADGSAGIDLIRQIKADETLRQVPVMLVSNYDDAQKEAIQAGAVRGFGKAALDHPQTIARLRGHLE